MELKSLIKLARAGALPHFDLYAPKILLREGDVAMLCASTEKAKSELGWVAKKNLEDMCNDL